MKKNEKEKGKRKKWERKRGRGWKKGGNKKRRKGKGDKHFDHITWQSRDFKKRQVTEVLFYPYVWLWNNKISRDSKMYQHSTHNNIGDKTLY